MLLMPWFSRAARREDDAAHRHGGVDAATCSSPSNATSGVWMLYMGICSTASATTSSSSRADLRGPAGGRPHPGRRPGASSPSCTLGAARRSGRGSRRGGGRERDRGGAAATPGTGPTTGTRSGWSGHRRALVMLLFRVLSAPRAATAPATGAAAAALTPAPEPGTVGVILGSPVIPNVTMSTAAQLRLISLLPITAIRIAVVSPLGSRTRARHVIVDRRRRDPLPIEETGGVQATTAAPPCTGGPLFVVPPSGTGGPLRPAPAPSSPDAIRHDQARLRARPAPRAPPGDGQLRAPTTSTSRSSRSATRTSTSSPGTCTSRSSGRLVKDAVRAAGGIPFEFNTIGWTTGSSWATTGCGTRCRRAS
jgi:hypothetical protein